MLATPAIDVWVASATLSENGEPQAHLVPLSLAWIDDRVVLAMDSGAVTVKGIQATGKARLAVGPTRDVTVIDAVLERATTAAQEPDIAERYAGQADWDPRDDTDGDYTYLVLRPERIQAWRESNELAGRTLMRKGEWTV